MAEKVSKDSARTDDQPSQKDQKEEVVGSVPDATGDSIEATQETGSGTGHRNGGVRPAIEGITPDLDAILSQAGKAAGEAGFIFIGGLIPYRVSAGPDRKWEIDESKNPIRISNLIEAQSTRLAMALFAYLVESMSGDLAAELESRVSAEDITLDSRKEVKPS